MEKLIDIKVRSRSGAQKFSCSDPWAAISISTEPNEFPELKEDNRVGLLQLCFWDIENPRLEESAVSNKLMSTEQAKQVISFVQEMLPQIDTLLVHCEAGVCRSPAVAAAIAYILWGKESTKVYFNNFTPNTYVYNKILETHFGHNPDVRTEAQVVHEWNDDDDDWIQGDS